MTADRSALPRNVYDVDVEAQTLPRTVLSCPSDHVSDLASQDCSALVMSGLLLDKAACTAAPAQQPGQPHSLRSQHAALAAQQYRRKAVICTCSTAPTSPEAAHSLRSAQRARPIRPLSSPLLTPKTTGLGWPHQAQRLLQTLPRAPVWSAKLRGSCAQPLCSRRALVCPSAQPLVVSCSPLSRIGLFSSVGWVLPPLPCAAAGSQAVAQHRGAVGAVCALEAVGHARVQGASLRACVWLATPGVGCSRERGCAPACTSMTASGPVREQ